MCLYSHVSLFAFIFSVLYWHLMNILFSYLRSLVTTTFSGSPFVDLRGWLSLSVNNNNNKISKSQGDQERKKRTKEISNEKTVNGWVGLKKNQRFIYRLTLDKIDKSIHKDRKSVQFGHSVVFNSFQLHGRQASLYISNSWSLLKLVSRESVMPSNHLILCHPLLLMPSIFPSIRVFSNESILRIRWPKYWSFSFSISPSNEYSGLISFRMDWLDFLAVQGTLKSLLQYHRVQKHQFFSTQLSL